MIKESSFQIAYRRMEDLFYSMREEYSRVMYSEVCGKCKYFDDTAEKCNNGDFKMHRYDRCSRWEKYDN